ncbi:MAG: chitobiase/beta-hexosaminidase C-terminal domain-containing protein [Candidatus Omnitrophica bacterium]|nr:chitobiase/beta-hexosaminidase C-terminal domain-containing protein [Candidatus Omnitrophota bacterium]
MKSAFIIIIILATLFSLSLWNAQATAESVSATYYISRDGNDFDDGFSPETAWQTITRVNYYIGFRPGDRILFRRGDIWQNRLIIPASGMPDLPITFGAYGSGAKPVVYGICAEEKNYWNMSFIESRATGTVPEITPPLIINGCHDVNIKDSLFDGLNLPTTRAVVGVYPGYSGQVVIDDSPSDSVLLSYRITFKECIARYGGSSGFTIMEGSHDILVEGCQAYDNVRENIIAGSHDDYNWNYNIILRNNIVWQSFAHKGDINIGWRTHDYIIEGNYVENCMINKDTQGHDIIIRNNTVRNGNPFAEDITARALIRIMSGGDTMGGDPIPTDRIYVHDNTLILDNANSIGIAVRSGPDAPVPGGSDNKISNNIIYALCQDTSRPNGGPYGIYQHHKADNLIGYISDGNIFYSPTATMHFCDRDWSNKNVYSDLKSWANATGQDPNSAERTITNMPPVAKDQSLTIDEDTQKVIALAATDPEGKKLIYSVITKPNYGTLTVPTNTISASAGLLPNTMCVYTPFENYYGPDFFKFSASDGTMTSAMATVNINVANVNDAPVLNPIGDKIVDENTLLNFTVTATDVDGDNLTYVVNSLPQGATFNSSARAFSWWPTYTQQGSYPITFTVSDGSLAVSETITITVNNVPLYYTLSIISNYGMVTKDPEPTDPRGYEENLIVTLTAVPDEHYKLESWSRYDYGSGDWVVIGSGNPFELVMDSCKTIKANFTRVQYTITPTAGVNGSIDPATPILARHGSSKTFTITANAGYCISDVLVDGVSVGAVESYAFTNITRDHAIGASFEDIAPQFTDIIITPTIAKVGALLNIRFKSSEALIADPVVTVAGFDADRIPLPGLAYIYQYIVTGDEQEGKAKIIIQGADLTGNSGLAEASVLLDFTAPIPFADPPGGTFDVAPKAIELNANEKATIYYTLDGTTPDTSSTLYTGPLYITETTTLKFIAQDSAGNLSDVKTEIYIINNQAPSFIRGKRKR